MNIDQTILTELKRLQKRTGKSLGQLISELVAEAVALRENPVSRAEFKWVSRGMGEPMVPIEDKERLYRTLDA